MANKSSSCALYQNMVFLLKGFILGKNTSIILGDHFDSFIQEEIQSGRYSSASEVVRNGLRLLEDEKSQKEIIKKLLLQGENSGEPKLFNHSEFVERMTNNYGHK